MTTMDARSGRTGDTQESPAGDFTIRQATGNDLNDVIEIGHRTWPVIYEPIAGLDYVAMGLAKWWTSDVVAASIRRGQTLVAELAGDVIGMVAFGTQTGDFVVWKLYVLPEHHGKGIGSHLMDAVVERALEAGHTRITVAYPDGNSYAERFHRAHGFVESHREPSGSGLPDTIWMERELGSADGASDRTAGESDGPVGEST
ncbi:MAG TPA: GNAT family N-acetyltransferase [Intrasporangium sp.]|nr:GNAT family N-acetyltransferase [Intrasporangium sp.]